MSEKTFKIVGDDMSDGFHTFDELYDHRIALYIALCKKTKGVWRSRIQSDGGCYPGWFLLGIGTEAGKQITYHLPLKYWKMTGFAQTKYKAPKWDGHTSADVLKRLLEIK
jgi:hypothetical protein